MDGLICFWSLDRLELKTRLEGHKKGVYTLEWAEDIASLFSGGTEHDVYIWNPYVDKRIFLLKGHNHSLVKIKYMPGTSQLISADISGMVRVWDLRTFTTVQTLNVPLNEVHSLELIQKPKMIIVGGKRLLFYEYDEPTDTNLADEESCLCILYNSVFFCFVTAHPRSVKIWDAATGKLLSVFRDLTDREITCIALDKRQRKLFVGDSKGRVFSINVKNGALMKKFARHNDVSSSLVYCGETTRLMSCGWDGVVKVHDDKESDSQSETRAEFKQHGIKVDIKGEYKLDNTRVIDFQVNCLTYNENNELLASCSDDKTILLYNLKTYRQEAHLKHPKAAEIKCCLFLGNLGCLAAGDMSGKIFFWSVDPCPLKNTTLDVVINKMKSDTGSIENFAIKSMAFDESKNILITGDEMGYLRTWNCSDLIASVKGLKKGSSFFITEQSEGKFVSSIRETRAHDEGITSVCFVPVPRCIATCGFDCKAHVFNEDLDKIGSLLIGFSPAQWKLIVSKEERQKQQLEKALDLIKRLEENSSNKTQNKRAGPQTKEEKMGNEI